jgi:hypothetical protein
MHIHKWTKWEPAIIIHSPGPLAIKLGQSPKEWESEGQKRRCTKCNKVEIRSIG